MNALLSLSWRVFRPAITTVRRSRVDTITGGNHGTVEGAGGNHVTVQCVGGSRVTTDKVSGTHSGPAVNVNHGETS